MNDDLRVFFPQVKSKFFAKYAIEEEDEPIGDGTYSICMRCTSLETGAKYAVKIMNKMHDSSQELEALRQCGDHPNIVKLIEDVEDSSFKYIVFELLNGGELFSRIREHTHFSEDTARVFFKQLVNAVRYMHSRGIVHRDLKPENIMFISDAEDSQLKIVDFGFARRKTSVETSPCFTLDYAAPESLSKGTTKESRDMWSLGVILYTMLVGHTPFMPQHINKQTDEAKYRKQLTENISKGLYNKKSENYRNISDEAKELISSLLAVDELGRCNIEELFQHKWLNRKTEIPDEPIDDSSRDKDVGHQLIAEEPITIDDDSTDDSSGIVLSERNGGSSTSSRAEAELIMTVNKTGSCDEPRVQLPAAEVVGEVRRVMADDLYAIPIQAEAHVRLDTMLEKVVVPAEVRNTKIISMKETRMPKKNLPVEAKDEELDLPEPLLEMPSLTPFVFNNGTDETEVPAMMPTLTDSSSEDCISFADFTIEDVGAYQNLFHEQVAAKEQIRAAEIEVPQTPLKRGRGRPPKKKPDVSPAAHLVINPVHLTNAQVAPKKRAGKRKALEMSVQVTKPAKRTKREPSDLKIITIKSTTQRCVRKTEKLPVAVTSFVAVQTDAVSLEPAVPRKRGRPPIKRTLSAKIVETAGQQFIIEEVESVSVEPKKKRGRPRKVPKPELAAPSAITFIAPEHKLPALEVPSESIRTPKKRGRPTKKQPSAAKVFKNPRGRPPKRDVRSTIRQPVRKKHPQVNQTPPFSSIIVMHTYMPQPSLNVRLTFSEYRAIEMAKRPM